MLNLNVSRQRKQSLGFRANMIIEGRVLIEIKSQEAVARIAEIQVLTYLRLTEIQIGLLINYSAEKLIDGVKRIANNYVEENSLRTPLRCGLCVK